jgi:predicted Fe-S protein YdhL (DUF1289 family)
MIRIGADGRVASPCISVCRMDEATGLCAGCLRTLDEIAMWGMLDDEDRRAVWAEISMRAMRLGGKAETDAQR